MLKDNGDGTMTISRHSPYADHPGMWEKMRERLVERAQLETNPKILIKTKLSDEELLDYKPSGVIKTTGAMVCGVDLSGGNDSGLGEDIRLYGSEQSEPRDITFRDPGETLNWSNAEWEWKGDIGNRPSQDKNLECSVDQDKVDKWLSPGAEHVSAFTGEGMSYNDLLTEINRIKDKEPAPSFTKPFRVAMELKKKILNEMLDNQILSGPLRKMPTSEPVDVDIQHYGQRLPFSVAQEIASEFKLDEARLKKEGIYKATKEDPNDAMLTRDEVSMCDIDPYDLIRERTKAEKLFSVLTREPDNPCDTGPTFYPWMYR